MIDVPQSCRILGDGTMVCEMIQLLCKGRIDEIAGVITHLHLLVKGSNVQLLHPPFNNQPTPHSILANQRKIQCANFICAELVSLTSNRAEQNIIQTVTTSRYLTRQTTITL